MADIPDGPNSKVKLQRDQVKSSRIAPFGDEDWFKVQLKANNEYVFEVKGAFTDKGSLLDPVVGVFDKDGDLEAGDFGGGAGLDGLVSFRPDTTGTYFVGVGSLLGIGGSYKVSYGLNDGAPGDGDNGVRTEKAIKLGQTQQGSIEPAGDNDWFKINLKPGEYIAEARNVNSSAPFQADVTIRDEDGLVFATSDFDGDPSGRDNEFTVPAGQGGTYYLDVGDVGDDDTGSYRVTVAKSFVV